MKTWYIKRPSWGNRDLKQHREMPYFIYRQRMVDDKYVVSATHPQQPNMSGHARGRKMHLAESNKIRSKTLCNMMVDGVFEEHIDLRSDSHWHSSDRLNGWCRNCNTTQTNQDKGDTDEQHRSE